MNINIQQSTGMTELVTNNIIGKLYDISKNNTITSNFIGNLTVDATYLDYIDTLQTKYPELYITARKFYIKFKDPEVGRIFTEWLSEDGVGVTLAEMANVVDYIDRNWRGPNNVKIKNSTYTSEVFVNNQVIEDLTYLRYLTNCVKQLHQYVRGCYNLKRVAFPPKITTIGLDRNNPEFYNCSKLEYVDWGNVTHINASCFRNCTSLNFDKYPDQLVHTTQDTFTNTAISVSDTNNIDCYSGDNCPNITSILIKSPVTCLGCRAFCSPNLTSVKFEYASEPNIEINSGGSWNDILFNSNYPKSYIDFKNRIKIMGRITMAFTNPSKIIFRNSTPPTFTMSNGSFGADTISSLFNNNKQIYVPDSVLATYQSTTGWSSYTSQIHPLSEFSAADYDEDD